MDLWRGCGDRSVPRYAHYHWSLLVIQQRDHADRCGGVVDLGRLLDERHHRDLRPYPRESQDSAPGGIGAPDQQERESDPEPYRADLRTDVAYRSGSIYFRWAGTKW